MKKFFKNLIKIKKASILVERIMMTAFAVAGGAAVVTYTAGVINANKEVKLYQPGVPQVENGPVEEGTTIYACVFHLDLDKMRIDYENDKIANNRSYGYTGDIYRFEHINDTRVSGSLYNAGGYMCFRLSASGIDWQEYAGVNWTHSSGAGRELWGYGGTYTMTGQVDVELRDGYQMQAYGPGGGPYYTFENTAFRTTYVMPGFEDCVTIENLPWRL